MARFVNKTEKKWTPESIALLVYPILAKYTDFSLVAKNSDVPFENQVLDLDSLDLVEISMYLENAFGTKIDILEDAEYFAGNYTPRTIVDYMTKKLNAPATKFGSRASVQSKQNAKTDFEILMRASRSLPLQNLIKREYGVHIPVYRLRAAKSFEEYSAVINRAIAKKKEQTR